MEYPDLNDSVLFPFGVDMSEKDRYLMMNIDSLNVDELLKFINNPSSHPSQIEYAQVLYEFHMEVYKGYKVSVEDFQKRLTAIYESLPSALKWLA